MVVTYLSSLISVSRVSFYFVRFEITTYILDIDNSLQVNPWVLISNLGEGG